MSIVRFNLEGNFYIGICKNSTDSSQPLDILDVSECRDWNILPTNTVKQIHFSLEVTSYLYKTFLDIENKIA